MSEWTEELKEEIIAEYEGRNPTAENTTDIVEQLAEEYEKTPNGIRRILVSAGVYVAKAQTNGSKGKAKEGGEKTASKRVSKSDSIEELTELLNFAGLPVDMEILNKLTGKAAVYFTAVIKQSIGK